MYTNDDLITVECVCTQCDSDDIDMWLDSNNYRLVLKCNQCGMKDYIEL